MAPKCSVCTHEFAEEIDRLLVGGEPYRAIAKRYGMSSTSVMRHRQAHVSEALTPVVVGVESSVGPVVATLDRLERLVAETERVLLTARQESKPAQVLAAVKEARQCVEVIAKVRGELASGPTVQVVNLQTAPEWLAIRGALINALAPFPEAERAVVRAIEAVEAGS